MNIYTQYQKLRKYYLGIPIEPAEYKEGNSLQVNVFENLEACENDENAPSGGGSTGGGDTGGSTGGNISLDQLLNSFTVKQDTCEQVTLTFDFGMYLASTNLPATWLVYNNGGTPSKNWVITILNDDTNNGNVWGVDRLSYLNLVDTTDYSADANYIRFIICNVAHVDGESDFRLYVQKVEVRKRVNGEYTEWTTAYSASSLNC